MAFLIDIQHAISTPLPFSDEEINMWASLALQSKLSDAELTIRFVSLDEMSQLNQEYRKKTGPTNVLSFPSNLPAEILQELDHPFIGDIIISPNVLEKESVEQEKNLKSHWTHIIIHGVLHLLGYDHIQPEEEQIMQTLEIQLLNQLGIKNPYE
jgi:probable rRNA maturation factor